jgi:hypothetical protein
MRRFPAALFALLLPLAAASGIADTPAGTGDEISELSHFVVTVDDDTDGYLPVSVTRSNKETEDKLNAWAQRFIQHLCEADSIEIRNLHDTGTDPEGRLLWSLAGRDNLAELAGLVRFEQPAAPVGCGEYWYYSSELQIKSGQQVLEKCRVVHPFGLRGDTGLLFGIADADPRVG